MSPDGNHVYVMGEDTMGEETLVMFGVDSDGDGTGDNFEQDYGLDAQDPIDAADDDKDGFGNLREFKAGTDPLDRNSTPDIPATPWVPLLLH